MLLLLVLQEAMHHQGLRGSSLGEVLTVRWANDDNTNPFAIVERKRSHETAFVAAGMEAWQALPEEQRQARLQQLQMASALHTQKVLSCPCLWGVGFAFGKAHLSRTLVPNALVRGHTTNPCAAGRL